MIPNIKRTARFLILATMVCGSALAEDAALPGGASTLTESHGDWAVTCAIQTQADGNKTKLCAFSQQQIAGQTRQRALAIELRPHDDGVEGTLVLPFGLALQDGIVYQLDEGQPGAQQHFRTCLPAGCLIDVTFDARTVASLKAGNALKVKATADGGQEMVFAVSLTGFSSAYDRVTDLTK
ncbi:invasion associated locus B family protein [Stappia sp. P2PMeth1]|uniref:invasion associated locus B family protein n=1 Tax=Stappia sp. P2PMeth1 TaxID=2003586 RepID=UPI00164961A8|nr:invasion associated locus B family protein [Stappia sp. P2PMeth1]